jgi:hypothetical protein
MVGLTAEANSLESSQMSSQSSPCKCKSEPAQGSANTSPLNPYSLVYVRYQDHVIYKNVLKPMAEPAERETVGWLTKQNEEIMLIEHDRTIQNSEISSGQGNGIIILKNCILEIRELPLQNISNCSLNSQKTIGKGEYALLPKKRKTQPSRNQ